MEISIPPSNIESLDFEAFLDGFMYDRKVFLVDRVMNADPASGILQCEMDTERPLLVSDFQNCDERHPKHVSGADMVMMTVALGSMHAFFFHGCKWKEGWVGFGSRMRDVHFKSLSRIGPPIQMKSQELRVRKNAKQLLMELSFEFLQEGKVVYKSEQSAMFVRPPSV